MREQKVQSSVISLSAAIHMLQKMCDLTGGEFMLSKDQGNFLELLKRSLVPKETLEHEEEDRKKSYPLIKMCFPIREQGQKDSNNLFVYCVCHNEPKHILYRCQSCNAP